MGCSTRPVLAPMHTIYSDIVTLILYEPLELRTHGGFVLSFCLKIKDLNRKAKNIFGAFPDIYPFTQKLHMLDHVVEDVARYEESKLNCASYFAHFNHVMKRNIWMTSMRVGRTFQKTIGFINFSYEETRTKWVQQMKPRRLSWAAMEFKLPSNSALTKVVPFLIISMQTARMLYRLTF